MGEKYVGVGVEDGLEVFPFTRVSELRGQPGLVPGPQTSLSCMGNRERTYKAAILQPIRGVYIVPARGCRARCCGLRGQGGSPMGGNAGRPLLEDTPSMC